MQIQDYSSIEITQNFKTKNLKFKISEGVAASLIFILPVLVLFLLSI